MNLDLIIPTHNRAGLLKHCLDSVLKATIPSGLNVTVYVIDNSTDNTREIAQSYPDPGIRYGNAQMQSKRKANTEVVQMVLPSKERLTVAV